MGIIFDKLEKLGKIKKQFPDAHVSALKRPQA